MAENITVPTHIGVIPDGNRRWAQARGLPSIKGHEKGFEIFQPIAEKAFDLGVKVFSAWGFSTENWKRTQEEVGYLMGMFVKKLESETESLNEKNIRLLISGSRKLLDDKLITAIEKAEKDSSSNTGGIINICLNYGGKQELLDAVNAVLAEGKTAVTEADITAHLYHQLPDLDLIIRTSGERRLSGFMPWQSTYSEFYFSDKLWPDFTPQDLETAITDFSNRRRTFGGS